MKFKVTKLGVIDTMEIDLSKSFILFAGENGTGKTYAASFIYLLCRSIGGFILKFERKDGDSIFHGQQENSDTITGEIDPDKLYDVVVSEISSAASQKTMLQILNLGIQPDKFCCEVVSTKDDFRKQAISAEFDFIGIKKRMGELRYVIRKHPNEILPSLIQKCTLASAVCTSGAFGAHMFTAERAGIYTFSKEIAVGRLRNLEIGTVSRYPLPITDNLANAEDIKQAKIWESKYSSLADDIEESVLHGKLAIDEDGEIRFSTASRKGLSINQSSSTVKILAPLIFYLRHWSDRQNLLIIDEPELNLHPRNQVLLARIFVKMVNAGIRLIVSTHSDYIIREINNAIMAHELVKHKDDVVNEFNYDESLCLAKEKFQPYLFKSAARGNVSVEPLPVDRFGFSMPSIDETIDRQNDVTNTLYEALKYNHNDTDNA